jgi:hypothetical protein
MLLLLLLLLDAASRPRISQFGTGGTKIVQIAQIKDEDGKHGKPMRRGMPALIPGRPVTRLVQCTEPELMLSYDFTASDRL